MSKFESSAAYYYTLYTFKCLIGEIQIFLYYNILFSNIYPKNLFNVQISFANCQERGKMFNRRKSLAVEVKNLHCVSNCFSPDWWL